MQNKDSLMGFFAHCLLNFFSCSLFLYVIYVSSFYHFSFNFSPSSLILLLLQFTTEIFSFFVLFPLFFLTSLRSTPFYSFLLCFNLCFCSLYLSPPLPSNPIISNCLFILLSHSFSSPLHIYVSQRYPFQCSSFHLTPLPSSLTFSKPLVLVMLFYNIPK